MVDYSGASFSTVLNATSRLRESITGVLGCNEESLSAREIAAEALSSANVIMAIRFLHNATRWLMALDNEYWWNNVYRPWGDILSC